LIYYVQSVTEAGQLAADIAQGDLSTNPLSPGNEVASGLKSLQASLKHLTWQTQQIAKGDYKQHVSFMGDFSSALNNMVEQLREREIALEAEVEASEKKSQALQLSLTVFEDIVAQMSQLMIVMGKDTRKELFHNHEIAEVLYDISTEPQLYDWLSEQLSSDRCNLKGTFEIRLDHPDGIQWFSAEQHPFVWGENDAVVFVLTDITESRRTLSNLEGIANFDPLTNAYSRHYGMKTFNRWIEQQLNFALCFIDMDNLKYVNDELGHNEGDVYILMVSDLLKNFGEGSMLSRLGGDEFMLLAKDWKQEDAEKRLEELRGILVSKSNEPGSNYNHSLSYGVVEVTPDNTLPATDLLSMADEKMYFYKRAHKAERKT
jgi:diguanylate cyclase (GGDEF)-like protein